MIETVDFYNRFGFFTAKEITNVQRLKGKMLAGSTPRSVLEIATREALKKHGLKPETDIRFIYVQSVAAILTAVVSGKAAGGAFSAPTTSKAKEAGLNMLVDIAKANVPGLLLAYGVTEKYLKENPNTIYAFLKSSPKEWLGPRAIQQRPSALSANSPRRMIAK
jgi:NitT/TauT family transport system substrate-binding protein